MIILGAWIERGRYLNSVLRFVKRHLHGGPPDVVDVDALQQRVRELEEQNKKLESELALVKQQVRNSNSVTTVSICAIVFT